jgi:phosphohistidine phosphatase
MELFLVRHADAVPIGEGTVTDDIERPLSQDGERQVQRLAAFLQERGIRFDKIVTSPLLRAHQTAQALLAQAGGSAPELVLCKELRPGGKKSKLARFLLKLEGDALALVGHEPDLGELAGWLMGSKKAQIDFAKAGIACISCGESPRKASGTLRWLVTPDLLDREPAGSAQ